MTISTRQTGFPETDPDFRGESTQILVADPNFDMGSQARIVSPNYYSTEQSKSPEQLRYEAMLSTLIKEPSLFSTLVNGLRKRANILADAQSTEIAQMVELIVSALAANKAELDQKTEDKEKQKSDNDNVLRKNLKAFAEQKHASFENEVEGHKTVASAEKERHTKEAKNKQAAMRSKQTEIVHILMNISESQRMVSFNVANQVADDFAAEHIDAMSDFIKSVYEGAERFTTLASESSTQEESDAEEPDEVGDELVLLHVENELTTFAGESSVSSVEMRRRAAAAELAVTVYACKDGGIIGADSEDKAVREKAVRDVKRREESIKDSLSNRFWQLCEEYKKNPESFADLTKAEEYATTFFAVLQSRSLFLEKLIADTGRICDQKLQECNDQQFEKVKESREKLITAVTEYMNTHIPEAKDFSAKVDREYEVDKLRLDMRREAIEWYGGQQLTIMQAQLRLIQQHDRMLATAADDFEQSTRWINQNEPLERKYAGELGDATIKKDRALQELRGLSVQDLSIFRQSPAVQQTEPSAANDSTHTEQGALQPSLNPEMAIREQLLSFLRQQSSEAALAENIARQMYDNVVDGVRKNAHVRAQQVANLLQSDVFISRATIVSSSHRPEDKTNFTEESIRRYGEYMALLASNAQSTGVMALLATVVPPSGNSQGLGRRAWTSRLTKLKGKIMGDRK